MKIRPVGTQLLHGDGRTDREKDTHDDAVVFRNTANAPKMDSKYG